MRRRKIAVLLAASIVAAGLATPAHAAARTFAGCDAMRGVYANGVAQSGYTATHPSPSWIRIKPPAVSREVYDANKRLDRDGDGIACEVGR